MKYTNLYVLSAPSGGGKTSLIEALIKKIPALQLSVSYTTRAPRISEVQGKHYEFITLKDFQQKIRENDFVEYAKVFDHYYGTSRNWLNNKLKKGINVILEIDWQGMQRIKQSYPDAVSIFVVPPTLSSLRDRLLKRNEDHAEVVETRLKQAQIEIKQAKLYDYIVVNNDFQTALTDLQSIIRSSHLSTASQLESIQSLLNE